MPLTPAAITADEAPEGIALSHDGKSLYVTDRVADLVLQYATRLRTYYEKRLTIPRRISRQTVWFQSDSRFAPGALTTRPRGG